MTARQRSAAAFGPGRRRLGAGRVVAWLGLSACIAFSLAVQAHLMVARHGTLNFVDDGAYMVLSLPVSAFDGVDDDDDGALSLDEFNAHRSDIVRMVREHITLVSASGPCALQGILLSPDADHHQRGAGATQLTIMGRYATGDADGPLKFSVALFGTAAEERTLDITATRSADHRRETALLSPGASTMALFEN